MESVQTGRGKSWIYFFTFFSLILAILVVLLDPTSAKNLPSTMKEPGEYPVGNEEIFRMSGSKNGSQFDQACVRCGGYTPDQCSIVCGRNGFPYYYCLQCECLCHHGIYIDKV